MNVSQRLNAPSLRTCSFGIAGSVFDKSCIYNKTQRNQRLIGGLELLEHLLFSISYMGIILPSPIDELIFFKMHHQPDVKIYRTKIEVKLGSAIFRCGTV